MKLPIATSDDIPLQAEVWHISGGLAVQADVLPSGARAGTWAVLHIASGKRVLGGLRTKQQARALQDELLALDIDWTKKATKRWLKETVRLVAPILAMPWE